MNITILVHEEDGTSRYVWRDATITWLTAEVQVAGRRMSGPDFTGTVTYPRERVLSVEAPAS